MQHSVFSHIAGMLGGAILGLLAFPLPSHGDTITATGIGVIPVGSPDLSSDPVVVYAAVEGSGPDANSAIGQMNAKVQGVKTAVEKAGVDLSSFAVLSFYVYPRFGPSDSSSPVPVADYETYVNFQVLASSLNQVGAVLNAAIAAGATNVSTSLTTRSPGSQPSANQVAAVVADAMDQARTIATAAALSAGVKLGRLLSVEIKALQASGGTTTLVGADLGGRSLAGGGWGVEATNTYEARP